MLCGGRIAVEAYELGRAPQLDVGEKGRGKDRKKGVSRQRGQPWRGRLAGVTRRVATRKA